jgi:hypothetical protein
VQLANGSGNFTYLPNLGPWVRSHEAETVSDGLYSFKVAAVFWDVRAKKAVSYTISTSMNVTLLSGGMVSLSP